MARPLGSKDLVPRASAARCRAEFASKDGVLPLDVMLTTMRRSFAIAQRHEMNGDETRAFEYHKLALACAVQAAPYCHSRMQPKADPHDDDKKVEITIRRLVSDPSCRKCSDTVNADVPANGWMTRPHQME